MFLASTNFLLLFNISQLPTAATQKLRLTGNLLFFGA